MSRKPHDEHPSGEHGEEATTVENLMCEEFADNRPKLETKRLILRPFDIEDEADVYRICKEKESAQYTRSIPHPYPRAQAAHWIKQQPDDWRQGKSVVLAIVIKESARMIGSIGLTICESDQNAELGYVLEKESWGRGFCSEAAAELVRFGFENLGLHKVHAHHMISNPASGRILEKVGMREEGVLRGHVRKWGVFHDIKVWGILATEHAKQ